MKVLCRTSINGGGQQKRFRLELRIKASLPTRMVFFHGLPPYLLPPPLSPSPHPIPTMAPTQRTRPARLHPPTLGPAPSPPRRHGAGARWSWRSTCRTACTTPGSATSQPSTSRPAAHRTTRTFTHPSPRWAAGQGVLQGGRAGPRGAPTRVVPAANLLPAGRPAVRCGAAAVRSGCGRGAAVAAAAAAA